jgi:serine/threonine-protein kinase
MAPPPHVDRLTFLANLRQSGLLTDAQLTASEKTLPPTPRGRVVARELVKRGLLTKFQAERLLAGRTAGFTLGQYRILDQLGRGGMGRVFKAEHRTMGRTVALKVLAPDLLQTDRAQGLFLREVRAAALLVHPNVVTAYDANEIDGRYFLVIEYVDGPNLDQLVQQQGPLPVGTACDYVRQIANGLQCAHARGMVHRDLKPANILVQRRGLDGADVGLVKISDFGLARLHTPQAPGASHPGTILTKDNTVMGTPDYLSPEQARSLHKTDIRSDLYSVGCTFYFLLTGAVPFPGGNTLDKLIRHNTEKPTPVTELRKDAPAAVAAIVNKLLAKRPADRYQTPAELAAALEPFAVSGPTPWAPVKSASDPLIDDPEAAEGRLGDDSDPDSAALGSDEMSALANTVSRDGAPTPATAARIRPRARPRRKNAAGVWVTAVLGVVAGVAVLAAAAAGVLWLVGRLF